MSPIGALPELSIKTLGHVLAMAVEANACFLGALV